MNRAAGHDTGAKQKDLRFASYYGKKVLVTLTEQIPGGTVAFVRRDPSETNWPWTVSEFSTAIENLVFPGRS
jgi:hypothetical protein